jgi:DAK2 domain fusion protein YloV
VLETLDDAAVTRWCTAGLAALRRHEHEINQLNVYPVPDADTGTNLVLTLTAAERALAAGDGSGPALEVMARAALIGARGNSGVIVAQLLRGLADALSATPTPGGREVAAALAAAARAGYGAVAEPVEGTILSVATAAARAAGGVDKLETVVRAAADAAATALAHTPGQLPVLAAAGVVDAGGRGLVVLLDALVEVVSGAGPTRPAEPAPRDPAPAAGGGGFEVQYLLDAGDEAVSRLRRALGRLGDSLVVAAAGRGPWQVHVHVADAGAAIEAGVIAGRPYRISVTRLEPPPGARAAVVVASGTGLLDLFAAEGAVVLGGNPTAGDVLAAVRAPGVGQVVLLPDGPETEAVAAVAASEAASGEIRVSVVPTRSAVQALAALAVRDPRRRFEDDVNAMAQAAGACRYAQVCRAGRDALTVAGRCRAGDVLALVEGQVLLVGTDLAGVCRQLLDQLLGGGGELVSLVVGAEAPAGLGGTLVDHLADAWPFVEVRVLDSGQPGFPLLVGVE